jgi:hypothetical protein
MKNVPKKIYLQIGDYEAEMLEDEDGIENFNAYDRENITWCEDRVYSSDIEYALAPIGAGADLKQKIINAITNEDCDLLTLRCLHALIQGVSLDERMHRKILELGIVVAKELYDIASLNIDPATIAIDTENPNNWIIKND